MPKKWKEDLALQVNEEADKNVQKEILKDAAKELRSLADHHGIDADELITAFGRKVG